jgi:CTP:molybdopterin cytidylyltransferase MocA
LLDRALRACREAKLDPIIVVLGANAKWVREGCDLAGVRVILNDQWEEGMASSLRAGVASMLSDCVDAAVVTTCDMPFVNGEHLNALAKLAEREGRNVASWYEQWRGIPACFVRSSFPLLMQLEGDTGGRALLMSAPVVELPISNDVDTPDELAAARTLYFRRELC